MPELLILIITAFLLLGTASLAYDARQQARRAVTAQVKAEAAAANAKRSADRAAALAIPIGTQVRRRSTGLTGQVTRHLGTMIEAWTPGDRKFPYARPWTAEVDDLVVLTNPALGLQSIKVHHTPDSDGVAAAAAALLGSVRSRVDDTAVLSVVKDHDSAAADSSRAHNQLRARLLGDQEARRG